MSSMFQMSKEYLLIFFISMLPLFFSILFASYINRQQDNLYMDEDGRNLTFLTKRKFTQDFSSSSVEIQIIKALRKKSFLSPPSNIPLSHRLEKLN